MKISRLLVAVCAYIVVATSNAGAAIIDNGAFTTDTATGLDWLDLTETTNRSYDDISTKFGTGQEFDGWRYATRTEIETFWNGFGGDPLYYDGWSTQNNGLVNIIAPIWGDTYCAIYSCVDGVGFSQAITADPQSPGSNARWVALAYDLYFHQNSPAEDLLNTSNMEILDSRAFITFGSALVRVSTVPIPPALWLFGSGLLGLVRIARRKKTA